MGVKILTSFRIMDHLRLHSEISFFFLKLFLDRASRSLSEVKHLSCCQTMNDNVVCAKQPVFCQQCSAIVVWVSCYIIVAHSLNCQERFVTNFDQIPTGESSASFPK